MIFVIDGHSVCYRIFYKTPLLTNSKGEPTSILHSFINLILTLKEKHKPEKIYVVFDSKGETERHRVHKDYKAHREKTPEALIPQVENLKRILPYIGVYVVYQEATEADDLIYTLICNHDKDTIYLITKDKDLHQLVNDKVFIYDYQDDELIDRDKVKKVFGVYPEQICDLLALSGDQSDNIPGIKGIGQKTAAKLINDFGSFDNIFANIDKISGKLKEKLIEGKKNAYFSKELVKLNYIKDLKVYEAIKDDNKLREYLEYFELKTIINRLFKDTDNKKVEKVKEDDLVDVVCFIEDKLIALKNREIFYDDIELNDYKFFYDIKEIKKVKDIKFSKEIYDVKIISWMNEPDSGGIKKHKEESFEDFVIRVSSVAKQELEKLKEYGLIDLYENVELPVTEVLYEMEKNGIKINKEKVYQINSELINKLNEYEKNIKDYCGYDFNLNSPKQLSEILFEKMGLKPSKKTKTGFSTSEEALIEIKFYNPGHADLIDMILKYRELNKLNNTYTINLLNYVDENSRIHTHFKQTGTATGRISSTNPNLQNIPVGSLYGKRIRECFEAEEGYNLVSFDYSQIELRILASLSEDKNLIDAFKNDEDIHTKTAMEIFSIKEVDSKHRRLAKAVNFGIIYGLSPYGLARDTGISQSEAKIFIEKYFELYPGVKKYIDKVILDAREKGFTETILGRKRFISDINSANKMLRQRAERVAINAPIQGSAADIIKLAMIKIYEYLHKLDNNAKMLLQIHDELLFEIKEEYSESLAIKIKDIMETIVDLKVPLKVNYSIGKNWGGLKE
ncbi:DNA polymerase [Deferribacter thermophilus]|uniref:DNA polymerase n=1 Tax=Deferribacter thermophilus TaxID=53573 RepID=UPI003C1A03CF